MALKPCPRCKKLIPCGKHYCDECNAIIRKIRSSSRTVPDDDAKQYITFYRSAVWRRTSTAKLSAAGYKCEAQLPGCTGLATDVHHIKPIQTPEGWNLRLDWDNLEAVCVRCHNKRHRR